MAVQAPVAPTPPTPPSVPGVTLQDGGTVRDSNVPQNIKQSNDERLESQARQSVAQGDGGLSKTTTARPEKPAKPAKNQPVDASGGASQEGQTVIAPQQGAQALNQEAANKDLQTQTKAEATPQDRGLDNGLAGHGAALGGGAVIDGRGILVWHQENHEPPPGEAQPVLGGFRRGGAARAGGNL